MIYKPDLNYGPGMKSSKDFYIETIEEDDIFDITEMCVKLFSEAAGFEYSGLFFLSSTDWEISKKAVLDGKIIGCYLFYGESISGVDMNRLENLDRYSNKYGLHAVALGIMKEYRGLSYGRQLRDSVLAMKEYDYVWGGHLKTLNNLDNWLAYGRRLVGETDDSYFTLMDLDKNELMS